MSQRLADKVAVITGASKGIGAAIARDFAAHGASVVVNYASDKAGAERVVQSIRDADGRAIAFTPLGQVTIDGYRTMFDVNVLGTILCSQAAAARFPSTGGAIINIGRAVASMGVPGSVVYSATKGAIDSITRALATELGPKGVRVNAIDLGLIVTEVAEAAGMTNNDREKMWIDRSAIGRCPVRVRSTRGERPMTVLGWKARASRRLDEISHNAGTDGRRTAFTAAYSGSIAAVN